MSPIAKQQSSVGGSGSESAARWFVGIIPITIQCHGPSRRGAAGGLIVSERLSTDRGRALRERPCCRASS